MFLEVFTKNWKSNSSHDKFIPKKLCGGHQLMPAAYQVKLSSYRSEFDASAELNAARKDILRIVYSLRRNHAEIGRILHARRGSMKLT